MDMTLSSKDSLMHYGVPGMRWGKRKGSSTPKTSRPYSSADRAKDARIYGVKGQKQIENRVAKGGNVKVARLAVGSKQAVAGLGIGALGGVAILTTSSEGRAALKYGAQFVASSLSNTRLGRATVNTVKGTKALTTGYDLLQASLGADGVWRT